MALVAPWMVADTLPFSAIGLRTFDVPFAQISGILSIGMMSFATLLSMRPRWLEPTFDGLDKMYRLHKWLGVGGLLVGMPHRRLASAVEAASARPLRMRRSQRRKAC